MSTRTKTLGISILFQSLLILATAQNTGDFRTIASGTWTANTTWETFDGAVWAGTNLDPGTVVTDPAIATTDVLIQTGHTVALNANRKIHNLTVETGAKLHRNSIETVRRLEMYGDISCDGQIGEGEADDRLNLFLTGTSCLIEGNGDFAVHYLKKPNTVLSTSTLTINMDIILTGYASATITNASAETLQIIVKPGKKVTNLQNTVKLSKVELILESDASGDASFICYDVTYPGTLNANFRETKVERYLTALQWHYLGTPVKGAKSDIFDLGAGHSDIWLKPFNVGNNKWGAYISQLDYSLKLGRGYNCWVGQSSGIQTDETVTFSGRIIAGDVTTGINGFYGLTYNSDEGYNLISNPYTSALTANISSWIKTDVAHAVWVWDGTQYLFYGTAVGGGIGDGLGTLPGGIIPAMQGFFVKTTGAAPVLTIPDSDRVHHSQAYYKTPKDLPANTLRLDVVSDDELKDALFIRFDETASKGYDASLDIEKLFGLSYAPQLYCIGEEKDLSIHTLPFSGNETSIDIGFECSNSGVYTLNANDLINFDETLEIYLEDTFEDHLQSLRSTSTYSFVHDALNDPNRFNIHFKSSTSMEDEQKDIAQIFSHNKDVHIRYSAPDKGLVKIFNMMGQEVFTESISANSQHVVQLQQTGHYVVFIQSGNKQEVEKVTLQ